ncbi:MAG: DUF3187 family protein [Deltaproteobacteria bacterium]|nr:DUF3187 family protein [Deltaproteobacteria bacterium]
MSYRAARLRRVDHRAGGRPGPGPRPGRPGFALALALGLLAALALTLAAGPAAARATPAAPAAPSEAGDSSDPGAAAAATPPGEAGLSPAATGSRDSADPGGVWDTAPLALANQSPLALALAPFSPRPARVGPVGSQGLAVSTAYSSLFTRQATAGGWFNLDMELFSLELAWRAVALPGLELEVGLPFRSYSGGFLDHAIQGYHQFFGFPNGGRDAYPQDQVRFQAGQNGRGGLDLTDGHAGLGDLSLGARWALTGGHAVVDAALLGRWCFPTGDEDLGLGAGGPVAGLGLALERSWGAWFGNLNLMGFYAQEARLLESLDPQNNLAASLTLGWEPWERWWLLGQVAGGTPLYADTGLSGLDDPLCQLQLGLRHRLAGGSRLTFTFNEDLIHHTSPDFSLGLAWELAW